MVLVSRTNALLSFLETRGLLHRMYEKMQNDDFAGVVMVCLDVLESGDFPMPALKVTKSEDTSEQIRNEGNRAFADGKLSRALALYNKALLFAPPRSTAMKLAYSNRSALLHKLGCYSACLKDLYTCFKMGCPDHIRTKLEKRLHDCVIRAGSEINPMNLRNMDQFKEFFKISEVNVEIPCASSAVAVSRDSAGGCTVVAARGVPAGTVLALERAGACWPVSDGDLSPVACHYCLSVTLNLLPCTTCCYALFCSERCREICWKESHSIECPLMEILNQEGELLCLTTRQVVKMRQSCSTWDDFIADTADWGLRRMSKNSVKDIFDSKNRFSLLNFDEEKYLSYGKMFNAALETSLIISELRKLPSFMPSTGSKRKIATQSFARIMLILQVFPSYSCRYDVSIQHELNIMGQAKTLSFASFSFINKVRSSCQPNVLSIPLNDNMALVACKPIKSGEELLTSHIRFQNNLYHDNIKKHHQTTFQLLNALCACETSEDNSSWSQEQLLFLKKPRFSYVNNIHMAGFKKICKALTVLGDRPASPEYQNVLSDLIRLIHYIQVFLTNNQTV
ncbi:SET and MYND domain-containing protein 4 isoform X2 [Plutella xylostella]|nr:SET and MYND domain-containing protein 4 isoform X2 [Plutella xylostella]XP_037972859.2 SET and MYND domain-containing protein 4 isoform X2 [Plutella xylostella]